MTDERWRQIERLFLQAVECPLGERQGFLDRVCREDDGLRAELESLLSCDIPDKRLADIPTASNTVLGMMADSDSNVIGRRVGPYRIERLIGHGGMGSVYLGVRDDEHYEKQVAIKLLRRGMDTDFMLGRFRQERQILANLDHPFIARLLDGGATEDGLPYFVMEYVDGLPITTYCTEKKLTLDERLRLFRLVCEAVQQAHQNLVVHRDLKPGNILTTREGVPKLLDFGIAKVLDPSDLADATLTRREHRMLTPDYASPEQVKGLPVSTASDIYSLGVVLYELVAGRRPHRFASGSLADMERIICDVEPEKPSVAAGQAREHPPNVRKQLRRRLAGDLDNIILTALRKEPQRRYASASELSEDLRRHMETLPIMAREERWTYRAGKFIQRNRLGVVTVLLVIASLIGGIVMAAFQAGRSERRFQIARGLANSMLFELHDEMERLPGSTALRALTIRTVVKYLDTLAQDAGGDPILDLDIADAYRKVAGVEGHPLRQNLGQSATALQYYEKALVIYERHSNHDATRPRALRALITSHIDAGDIEARAGNLDAASARLQRVAAIAAQASERDNTVIGPDTWIYIYFRQGDEAETRRGADDAALKYYQKALEVARNWAAAEHSLHARMKLREAYVRVAQAQKDMGDLSSARDSFRLAMQEAEKLAQGPEATVEMRFGLIDVHHAYGEVLGAGGDLNLGDRAGALLHYRAALTLAEKLAADDPRDVRSQAYLAGSYRSLGMMLIDQDSAAALQNYRTADAISQKLIAAEPLNIQHRRDIAGNGIAIGRILHKMGKNREAHETLTGTLELMQTLIAANPQRIGWLEAQGRGFATLGSVLLARRDLNGALNSYQNALSAAEKLLKIAPSSLYFQRGWADAAESLGLYYLTVAERSGLSPAQRAEMLAQSQNWFRKSYKLWQDWTKRKVATPYADRRQSGAAALLARVNSP